MTSSLPFLLTAALLVHAAAHLAIAGGLAWRREWVRSALALLVPPLAPYWAWRWGMRRRGLTWWVSLAAYAACVAVA